jgi:hypothetical protein
LLIQASSRSPCPLPVRRLWPATQHLLWIHQSQVVARGSINSGIECVLFVFFSFSPSPPTAAFDTIALRLRTPPPWHHCGRFWAPNGLVDNANAQSCSSARTPVANARCCVLRCKNNRIHSGHTANTELHTQFVLCTPAKRNESPTCAHKQQTHLDTTYGLTGANPMAPRHPNIDDPLHPATGKAIDNTHFMSNTGNT